MSDSNKNDLELLPCPFCGGEPHMETCYLAPYVICKDCWSKQGDEDRGYSSEAAAAAAWNTRETNQVTKGSASITKGELEYAKRRALNKFDEWNDITGFVQKHTGYYYELQSVIEDAVECGAQQACGVEEPLSSENDLDE